MYCIQKGLALNALMSAADMVPHASLSSVLRKMLPFQKQGSLVIALYQYGFCKHHQPGIIPEYFALVTIGITPCYIGGQALGPCTRNECILNLQSYTEVSMVYLTTDKNRQNVQVGRLT